MKNIRRGKWSIACVCMVLGFMLAVQLRTTEDIKSNVSFQRIEDISARLLETEHERDKLKEELQQLKHQKAGEGGGTINEEIQMRAGLAPLEGQGVKIRLEDSNKTMRSGENPNLYVIHDDDLLRVVNELRAAGAEAIAINGQRLLGTSEIRCAGPTLSVNNVRSSAPFEVSAIGNKKDLENAMKMRGGVAETLKVWGIQIQIEPADNIYIPAYKGTVRHEYAKLTEERQEEEK